MTKLILSALITFGFMASSGLALAQEEGAQPKLAPSATAKKLVLPLDHGPHAQVTPWVNQQRRQRAEAEEKAKAAPQEKLNQDADGK